MTMRAIKTGEFRHQVYSTALTVMVLAILLAAVEIGLQVSGFVLTFPLPPTQ
jgi:hypothetical protein